MKAANRAFLCFVSMILCAVFLFSCSNASEVPPFKTVVSVLSESSPEGKAGELVLPPAITALAFDKEEISLIKGEGAELSVTIAPDDAWNKEIVFESDNEAVASVDKDGKITALSPGTCTVTVSSVEMPNVTASIKITVKAPVIVAPPKDPDPPANNGDSDGATAVAQPVYINGILIANKTYALPPDYNPGVDGAAYAAFQEMKNAAAAEGISLWIASGFRSFATQRYIYNNYVAADGQAAADRYSARPGHSEHQTGLAFDLNWVNQAFGQTVEGLWLKNNCHKYGFIIRYPEGKEHITGYMYEPWHVRYLGVDIATAVYESGLSLEEYLGITSVYAEG